MESDLLGVFQYSVGEAYKLLSFSLCNFLNIFVTSNLFGPHLISILFSKVPESVLFPKGDITTSEIIPRLHRCFPTAFSNNYVV